MSTENQTETGDICTCPRADGYRIRRRTCAVHAEMDAAHWQEFDRRKFGTDVPYEPTPEFVVQAFAEGARALWPDGRDPGWHVTFQRWLADFVIEHAWPGEVLTGLGDVWAKCGCGERIDVDVEDGKTITSGDVREAYRAHLIAAVRVATPTERPS